MTRVMVGFEDLTGQTLNGLRVTRLVSRRPVLWELVCTRCNSSWHEAHASVRYRQCRNATCGRTANPRTPGSTANVGVVPVAARSRDSQSVRDYQHQQSTEPVIRWTEPTFQGADPDSIRNYLDHMETKS